MKKKVVSPTKKYSVFDFGPWNFIIFILLGFVLIVMVAFMLQNKAVDLGAKAGIRCPALDLPRPESCPGGKWVYARDADGCLTFDCPTGAAPVVEQ